MGELSVLFDILAWATFKRHFNEPILRESNP